MSKPAPVPLFNYKKRQRQALVSDPDLSSLSENKGSFQHSDKPNQNSSNFTPNSAKQSHAASSSNPSIQNAKSQGRFTSNKPTPGLMDISGKFSNFGSKASSLSPKPQVGRGNNSCQGSFQSSSYKDQQTVTSFGNPQPSRGRGNGIGASSLSHQGASQNRNAQLKLDNFSSSHPQNNQTTAPRGRGRDLNSSSNFSNGRQGALQDQQWGSNRPSNPSTFSVGKQVPCNSKALSGSKGPNRSSAINNAGKSVVQNNSKGSFHKNTTHGFAAKHSQFKMRENSNPMDTRNTSDDFRFEDDGILNTRKEISVQNEAKAKDSVKPATDTSMRIFTCPIASLKSWVGLKAYNGPVMFEVYGILDSATVKNNMGTGKEFVLRDDTDSIKCVFYEIDRDLPRLTRGQVHRVVGMADKRRGLLQVVSVRPALKEERRVCQAAGAVAHTEMERLAAGTNEQ